MLSPLRGDVRARYESPLAPEHELSARYGVLVVTGLVTHRPCAARYDEQLDPICDDAVDRLDGRRGMDVGDREVVQPGGATFDPEVWTPRKTPPATCPNPLLWSAFPADPSCSLLRCSP